eukprot:scaffold3334_cov369-Prasinococcus_capsulatus_cf.AAC.15
MTPLPRKLRRSPSVSQWGLCAAATVLVQSQSVALCQSHGHVRAVQIAVQLVGRDGRHSETCPQDLQRERHISHAPCNHAGRPPLRRLGRETSRASIISTGVPSTCGSIRLPALSGLPEPTRRPPPALPAPVQTRTTAGRCECGSTACYPWPGATCGPPVGPKRQLFIENGFVLASLILRLRRLSLRLLSAARRNAHQKAY